MVVASVIVELDLANELYLDSIMFNFSGFSVECHIHLDEMHNYDENNELLFQVPPFLSRFPRHRKGKISPSSRFHP